MASSSNTSAAAQNPPRHHPRKTANVDFKAYQSEHQVARFKNLRTRLVETTRASDLTEAHLSLLTAQLIQCNEDTLGRNEAEEKEKRGEGGEGYSDLTRGQAPVETREITKLPVRLFRDYSDSGALFQILMTYFKLFQHFVYYKHSPADRLRMLKAFQQCLVQAGYLTYPRVYFESTVNEAEREKLLLVLKKHKAEIVSSTDKATHIVHGVPGPVENVEEVFRERLTLWTEPEFIRPIERQTTFMLVHWWYYPDSYDAWIDASEVDVQEVPPQKPRTTPYHVTTRFVRDLERFNEWMNELDYAPEELMITPAVGEKRPLSDPAAPPDAKRAKTADEQKRVLTRRTPLELPCVTNVETAPTTLKTRREGSDGPIPSGHAETVSQDPSSRLLNVSHSKGVSGAPLIAAGKGDGKGPPCAPWFSMDTIHEIERNAMPEFFNGLHASKTPQVYKECRDFMINTYEQRPDVYLTQTACRRSLAGDACAILRLHECLEHWGLINYNVTPDLFPVGAPSLVNSSSVLGDVLKFSTRSGERKNGTFMGKRRAQMLSVNASSNATYTLRPNIYAGGAQIQCSSCERVCATVRFNCLKNPDTNLCPDCFNCGRYDSSYMAVDFVKVQNPAVSLENGWSDQETFLLLKGMNLYPDDWEAIAKYVGTKSAKECVLHFLRMPIEDSYLDPPIKPSTDGFRPNMPFADSPNPVLTLIAFLANAVHPDVAAAAAQGALVAMQKLKAQQESDAASSNGGVEVGKSSGGGDAMEVSSDQATGEKQDEAAQASGDAGASSSATTSEGGDAMDTTDSGETSEEAQRRRAEEEKKKQASIEEVKLMAAGAVGAMAARAKQVVEEEEEKIKRLVVEITEAQVKKLEMKLRVFEKLESDLESELQLGEKRRQQFQVASIKAQEEIRKQRQLLDEAIARQKAKEGKTAESKAADESGEAKPSTEGNGASSAGGDAMDTGEPAAAT